MIHVPGTAHIQSSIAAPTNLSRRDTAPYEQGIPQRFNMSSDPLNGSLGPFLASCALVFVVILVIIYVVWSVHRRVGTRMAHTRSSHAVEEVPSLNPRSLVASLTFPPDRLRIRSPIQRLRLLRSSSANHSSSTIPLWTAPATPSPRLGAPDIVLSRASPILPVSPSLTTSCAPSIASVGKLEVPGAKRAPLVRVQSTDNYGSSSRKALKLQAKISSPAKKDKLPSGNSSKVKKVRFLADKENQIPQMDARPKRAKRTFGSRLVF